MSICVASSFDGLLELLCGLAGVAAFSALALLFAAAKGHRVWCAIALIINVLVLWPASICSYYLEFDNGSAQELWGRAFIACLLLTTFLQVIAVVLGVRCVIWNPRK